ncbi:MULTISPECIES: NADH:flavin oxidoreductase [Burkholderiaceae]|uniref:2,4-dienoyl-CoA reductase [NADPH] n=1 Tax=Caballeronia sordidicola TaxID=196367 RepID=A0A242M3B1_CABSO|nr:MULTISPECIES: NADH:flavin oxidoreductase [Burkholderiaceae]AME26999.1 12-oxophytodienoate reductase [Burkholderia sp. PAMC 26561]AME27855.1 12-oxophytodienoate reductase [Burkholderia sp. PAMC 26561]OTP65603.1 2,4-dienoyl-CoA reductase [NADPH] [Caballeronia sordidicola]
MKPFSPLFQPFKLKSLTTNNRVVMAPMTRRKSPGGIPGADVAAYYRRRAEGGVGLIITEGTTIDRPAASNHSSIPNLHDSASIEGWREVVRQVHEAGGKIAPQLWHLGLMREAGAGPHPDAISEGPSAVSGAGKPMNDEDLQDTVLAFSKAARTAKDIGFDAVEVHGAHGYLIDQFFWEKTNRREDQYGASVKNRGRLAAEIIKAIRREVGSEFVISFRLSQWRVQDYDSRLAATAVELEEWLGPLADAGVDLLHASTRRFWEPEFAGSDLNLAGWIKKLSGLPTITVGSVGLDGPDFLDTLFNSKTGDSHSHRSNLASLEALSERLLHKEFDLVAVGRALANDPQWLAKIREERSSELRPFSAAALDTLS